MVVPGLSYSRQAPSLLHVGSLVAARGLLSCGMRTLSCGMPVGSNSLTRDRTPGPLHWEHGVLTTAPPGKSHTHSFISAFLHPLSTVLLTVTLLPRDQHVTSVSCVFTQLGRVARQHELKGCFLLPPLCAFSSFSLSMTSPLLSSYPFTLATPFFGKGVFNSACFLLPIIFNCVISKSIVRRVTHNITNKGVTPPDLPLFTPFPSCTG